MSLARLRLHHGQRSGDASLRSLDVAGSDPPSRQTSIGAKGDGAGQPHPPRRYGVTPSQQSVPYLSTDVVTYFITTSYRSTVHILPAILSTPN